MWLWVKHFSEQESQRTLIYLHNSSGKKENAVFEFSVLALQFRIKLSKRHCLVSLASQLEKSEVEEKWSLNSAHQQALGYFTVQQPRKSISPSSPFKKPHKGRYTRLNCSTELLCSMFLKHPLDLVEKPHSSNLEST